MQTSVITAGEYTACVQNAMCLNFTQHFGNVSE